MQLYCRQTSIFFRLVSRREPTFTFRHGRLDQKVKNGPEFPAISRPQRTTPLLQSDRRPAHRDRLMNANTDTPSDQSGAGMAFMNFEGRLQAKPSTTGFPGFPLIGNYFIVDVGYEQLLFQLGGPTRVVRR
jgi:hypothetical protein